MKPVNAMKPISNSIISGRLLIGLLLGLMFRVAN